MPMKTEPPHTWRVLVVDDDPLLLANVTEGLDILGNFEVIAASDGATGLERFFEARPDCVVVDVRMPGVNGYQFVRALRGDPATVHTPVIILSALVQDREQLAGLLSGADAYLIKPVKLMDLVQAVEQAVKLTSDERLRALRDLSDM
jgi:two-component system cell cycle response regulator